MIHPAQRLNMNHPTTSATWSVDGCEVGSIQASGISSASWGSATITVYRSNDGVSWLALPTPVTKGPGNFMTDPFDIDFGYLRVEISTDEAADEYVLVTLWTRSEPSP